MNMAKMLLKQNSLIKVRATYLREASLTCDHLVVRIYLMGIGIEKKA